MRSARLIGSPRPAVVLVAHGSRDPRAAASTEALARAVRRGRPEWLVRAAYLDHAGPRPVQVLSGLGARRVVLVPLLLTEAYHGRVDLPAVLEEAADLPVEVTLAGVLGPRRADLPVEGSRRAAARMPRLLVEALVRRLPVDGFDAVVLAAAGTRDAVARETVEHASVALGERLGVPAAVSYSSGVGPRAGDAVRALQEAGARRVAVAGYFLAPGLLHDQAVASAWEAGAVAVAEPLGDAPELVGLIAERVAAAGVRRLAAA
ncbi:sirohydrochlorin ferrochelatase [Actinoplanes octamycinicus]|uniref:Sirohydrochlorin ferrochelatase n=1 Tax=Actinoplanes octamycinicus TaxID=135948 RepID=A0A7W7GS86_9ACTN|nr:CbiX/SirB N-terminal domain-containing protein [Actinoplanes octamycinicus]MBB4737276.1 sirohydrochlorin ferrochelatase [Actinoplanes octamycinicus]GIE63747.1 cobalamin biosynthesis protein [Actinoplanes octamycinicus]